MNLAELSAEFPKAAVHWRVQGQPFKGRNGYAAMALAYIDARDVMDRLDAACGPGNWQDEYTETASGRVICRLSIRIDGEWVTKSDGAGGTAVEAEKGGVSDALKRAAVKWGVGRYLYRLDSPWVACEVREKNGKAFWKAWAEDPWSKVKVIQYFEAEAAAGAGRDVKQGDSGSSNDPAQIAIDSLKGADTIDALAAIWSDLPRNIQHNERVIAAKDDRKKALQPKELAQ